MTSSPLASPSPVSDLLGTFRADLWDSIWGAASSSPIVGALFAFVAVGILVTVFRWIRWAPLRMAPRDPVRRFPSGERSFIFSRAGNRCERHLTLFGRCRSTKNLQADHVHPHSARGSTNVANGQALCSHHNKLKAARVPYNWQLRSLEKRRNSYFPPGMSAKATRRASR